MQLRTLFFIYIFILSNVSISLRAQSFSNLTDLERNQEFKTKTEQRIKDLEQNIKTIGQKELIRDIRTSAISSTVKYFISEDNVFQVSSINQSGVREYPIRKYLNRLMILPYERVEIEWFESRWVTKFRQGPDGKYYGVIRIYQVFRGYGLEGELKYKDITEKDIEVVITVLEVDMGNAKKEILDVKLGDVNIKETRKS